MKKRAADAHPSRISHGSWLPPPSGGEKRGEQHGGRESTSRRRADVEEPVPWPPCPRLRRNASTLPRSCCSQRLAPRRCLPCWCDKGRGAPAEGRAPLTRSRRAGGGGCQYPGSASTLPEPLLLKPLACHRSRPRAATAERRRAPGFRKP
jgi:hypothetical protein